MSKIDKTKDAEAQLKAPGPAAEAEKKRQETATLLKTPHLPDEFIDYIDGEEMIDYRGDDMKRTVLLMCSNIDVLLQKISQIPKLSESAQGIKAKLKTLTGEPLYESITEVLEEVEELAETLIQRGTDAQTGADYLTKLDDAPETPRADLEKSLHTIEKMRSVNREVIAVGQQEYSKGLLDAVLAEMKSEAKSEFFVTYRMQRVMEDKINQALEKGRVNNETAELILKATIAQLSMAYNVIGQHGMPITAHFDEDDMGRNDAERQSMILDIYMHMLGAIEGLKYLRRFY